MLQTLAVTGPIYIVIALGWLAGRMRIFSYADMRVLGTYVVKFALPALIFTALSQRSVGDIFNGRYVFAYAAGSLIVMGGAYTVARRRLKKGVPMSALSALGMSSSNSGYIGYPIAVQMIGPGPAAVGLALCMVIENLLMLPLALAVADSADSHHERWHVIVRRSLLQLLRNPVILAILAGISIALLDLKISGPLASTINMLALSSTAVALFVIGGTLVGLQTRGMRRHVSTVSLGKLVLHPLAVGVMVWLVPPGDPPLRAAAVIFASVPMLSIYPIVAQKYGLEQFSAAALLLTTTLSFLTISAILWLLGAGLGWIAWGPAP